MIDLHQESKTMITTTSLMMRIMKTNNSPIAVAEAVTKEEAVEVEAAGVDSTVEEVFTIKKEQV